MPRPDPSQAPAGPAAKALRLVVRGFVEPTLAQMPEGLRAELEAIIEARLDRIEGAA